MSTSKINILMAINQKYILQMKTLICSLGINNKNVIDIYLLHSELNQGTIEELKGLTKKFCGGTLHEIKLDKMFLKNAKILNHFSIEMYYRIFASEYLPDDIERILWLDADIVCLRDLKEFYDSKMDEKSIMVCMHREKNEEFPKVNAEAIERLALDRTKGYFNSGVILMDMRKIRENFNHKYTCELLEKYKKKLIYPDQDILNILYQDDVKYADKTIYNYQVHYDWDYQNEVNHIKENVVILHFAGPAKPWGYKTFHFSYQYYWKYFFLHGSKRVYFKCMLKHSIYEMFKKVQKLWRK